MQQGSGEPAVPFSASKLSKAAGVGGLGDEAIQWLISAAGSGAAGSYVTGSKGWAGASHWRYRTLPPQPAGQGGQGEEQEQSAAGGRGKKRAARCVGGGLLTVGMGCCRSITPGFMGAPTLACAAALCCSLLQAQERPAGLCGSDGAGGAAV